MITHAHNRATHLRKHSQHQRIQNEHKQVHIAPLVGDPIQHALQYSRSRFGGGPEEHAKEQGSGIPRIIWDTPRARTEVYRRARCNTPQSAQEGGAYLELLGFGGQHR